jgi:hemoglobin
MSELSLYERLGGEPAIIATVGMFYERILADELLAPFFTDMDMDMQVAKQISFMTMAFGGPHDFGPKKLRSAHARLISRGLGDEHFNRIMEHLEATLIELSMPEDLVKEVLAVIENTRPEVLNK